MSERRMFSKTITNSDNFLDMSTSARCLYFHLGMQADDDGFVSSPKATIRSSNCSEDDLKLLITKGFVIAFNSGIVVLTHWKMHNYIQKDRYKPTAFREEREQLVLENNVYERCIHNVSTLESSCIRNVSMLDTEDSLSKGSKGKGRVRGTSCAEPDRSAHAPAVIELTLNDKTLYPITQKDVDEWQILYPAVDVMQQLRNMKGWCDSNPAKRKTRKGIRRFINSWLSKEQDKGGMRAYGTGESTANTESASSTRLW